MASSESGEDFESADEDFDTIKKLCNISTVEAKAKLGSSQVTVKDQSILKISKTNEDIDLKDEKYKSGFGKNKNINLVEGNIDLQLTSTKSKSEIINKETEVIPQEPKDSESVHSSLNLDVIMTQGLGATVNKQCGVNENTKTSLKSSLRLNHHQPSMEPFARNISKSEIIDTTELKTCLNRYSEIPKTHDESKVEIEELSKSFKNINQATEEQEINEKSLDGWEIEEVEDGFDIPVTLDNFNGQSIKFAQENISHSSQENFKSTREEDQGWGGWGGWGVSSILSTATDRVSTLSSQVTAGLSTIIENTVGAPNPESLATDARVSSNKPTLDDILPREDALGYSGIGSLVSGVSLFGSTVINRGLDTLETLGKKTMEVLQEGDPGLMKKRALLFPNQDKPVLSQILKEAKAKADNSDKEKEEKETARKVHFESLFDDFQGMVHLEALEMLSTQCELKLQSLLLSQSGTKLLDIQETLSQAGNLCELYENEEDSILSKTDFSEKVTKCVKGLNVNITAAKIIQVNEVITDRLTGLTSGTPTIVNQTAISSLAEFTAAGMELYHKSAELVLAKSLRNIVDEAESYVELTTCLCARVSGISNEFTQLLTRTDPIANSALITNIFLEASNSCSYIRNSCQLLVPILQNGAISS